MYALVSVSDRGSLFTPQFPYVIHTYDSQPNLRIANAVVPQHAQITTQSSVIVHRWQPLPYRVRRMSRLQHRQCSPVDENITIRMKNDFKSHTSYRLIMLPEGQTG